MPTEKSEAFTVDATYFQVRNIDAHTWGLFHPDEDPHEAKWWAGEGNRSFHRNGAQRFDSPGEARKFRLTHFTKEG